MPQVRKLVPGWKSARKYDPRSQTQLWRDAKQGKFPVPVQVGPNSIAFYEDELIAHRERLPRVAWANQSDAADDDDEEDEADGDQPP